MALARLENRAARAHFLGRHALAQLPTDSGDGGSLLELIERLGFVQLDSINTVARAHDMILHARRTTYRPPQLKRLYETDRVLFEHWTHDAAMIPMAFYPHWHLRFQRDADLLRSRWASWRRDGFEEKFDTVLQHVRDHGPVTSSDLGQDEKKSSGGWWDWHPSKTALEYLWRSGALTVVGRDGFRKRYDLTERVIEEHLYPTMNPNAAATIDWLCNAALDRLAFASSGEIAAFWDTVTAAEAKDWVARELAGGRLERIVVLGADGRPKEAVARPGLVDSECPVAPGKMRVLSPFDPAFRDRKRTERLFGFHYRIEVFVPEAKRRYGYYVFPLLEGDRLVGRVDMKAFRECRELRVRALWPERGIKWGQGRLSRFEAALDRVRRFAGMDRTVFLNEWLREPI
ncbi:winged helix-turn-helix domain-containing protein [Lutimaribacter marinistellae]|uniref:Winged helix-turn-helix domain-containing protein n=1 Tax=Lutimaribacter marinistellae TaxID=1820329 RepID=A0ABV7TEL7_9RHOB